MSKNRIALALLAAALCAAAVPPVAAGVDVDFGANIRIDDNTNLFFNISSRYFDRDRVVVDRWGPRFTNPDDLAVFFFLAQQSGRSPDVIFALRRQGLNWWEVGVRVGVPMDAWFVPVQVTPGPPYGKAYGHWKKHRKHPSSRPRLSDADARNLVAVRVIHEYYGMPVDAAMRLRASGRPVDRLVVDEYDRRHSRPMHGSVKKSSTSKSSNKKPHSDKKSQGHNHPKNKGSQHR